MKATRLFFVLAAALLFVGQAQALPIAIGDFQSDDLAPKVSVTYNAMLEAFIASSQPASPTMPYTPISLMALGGLVAVSLQYHRSRRRQWRRIQDQINGRIA
jgi:hypothetical protein